MQRVKQVRNILSLLCFLICVGCTLDIKKTPLGGASDSSSSESPSVVAPIIGVSYGNYSFDETAGTGYVEILASQVSSQDVVLSVALLGSSQRVGALPIEIVIPAGQDRVLLPVAVANNNLFDGNETIKLIISTLNTTVQVNNSSSNILIKDDELPPDISFTVAPTVAEAVGSVDVAVSLSLASSKPVKFGYYTQNNTAISGSDYTHVSGTFEVPAGQTAATLTIPILNDNFYEATENFYIYFVNPENGTLVDYGKTIAITSEDVVPVVSFSHVSTVENEGSLVINVSLDKASDVAVSFNFSTQNNTATSGTDYTAQSTTALTIPAGNTTSSITVSLVDDLVGENDESFYVNVSSPANATLSVSQLTLTILNEDVPRNPTMYIDDVNRSYSMDNLVDLKIFYPPEYTQMYVTNTIGCASGGSWTAILSTVTNWTINPAQIPGTGVVYLKLRTASGVESSCVSDSITMFQLGSYTMCSATTSTSNTTGYLYDSGGPAGNYGNNQECNFEVTAGLPLTVFMYNTVTEEYFDYLFLYDTYQSNNIGYMTGTIADHNYNVPSGHLIFRFQSGPSGVAAGFRSHWIPSSFVASSRIFAINNDDAITSNSSAKVNFFNSDFTEVYITNAGNCSSGGTWTAFGAMLPWTLASGGVGTKTVRLKLRDAHGNETPCYSDTIELVDPPVASLSDNYMSGTGRTNLSLTVWGSYLTHYKYKMGASADTDCLSPLSYSSEIPLSIMITDSIAGFDNIDLKVCVLGKNSVNEWQADTAPTELIFHRSEPSYIQFSGTGYYFNESNQTIQIPVEASKASTGNLNFRYEIFGDLAVFGGSIPAIRTGSILSGNTTTTIDLNLSEIPGADLDKSITLVLTWADSPGKLGLQTASTIVIKDSERVLNRLVKDFSDDSSCLLMEPGTLRCQDANGVFGQIGAISNFKTIVSKHCILDVNDFLYCYGDNTYGQLGQGNRVASSVPILVTGFQWKKVMAIEAVVCGIDYQDDLYCWGSQVDYGGGAGNGSSSDSLSPTKIDNLKYRDLALTSSSGGVAGCAVAMTGEMKCWGANGYNVMGDATYLNRMAPAITDSGTSYLKVALNYFHACGITASNTVRCWGSSDDKGYMMMPYDIPNSADSENLVMSGTINCSLSNVGNLKCWGYEHNYTLFTIFPNFTATEINPGVAYTSAIVKNNYGNTLLCGIRASGQLDCAGTTPHLDKANMYWVPNHRVMTKFDSENFIKIKMSSDWAFRACGITASKHLKCFRSLQHPLLSTDADTTQRTLYESTLSFSNIANECGLDTNGYLYCWGTRNAKDVLTTGMFLDSPITLQSTIPFKKFSNSGGFLCGIDMSDKLYCIGTGYFGDGAAPATASNMVAVDSAISYKEIKVFSSGSAVCGITSADKLRCWGDGSSGQLGNNSTSEFRSPVSPDSATNYSKLATTSTLICGLTTGSKIKCWGTNWYGGIGDNTQFASTPVAIDSANNYTQIASLGDFNNEPTMCGLRSSGAVYCWGADGWGQLGQGSTGSPSATPVALDGGFSFSTLLPSSLGAACGVTSANKTVCWGLPYSATPTIQYDTALIKDIVSYSIPTSVGTSVLLLETDGRLYRTTSASRLPGSGYGLRFFEFVQGILDR